MPDLSPPSWAAVPEFHKGWAAAPPADADAARLSGRTVQKLGLKLGRARANLAQRAAEQYNQERQAVRPAADDPSLAEFEAEWNFRRRQLEATSRQAPHNTALHYNTGWLPEDSPLFRRIESYLRENVQRKPCEAPRAEATRVNRARADKAQLDAEIQNLRRNGDPDNKLPVLELRSQSMAQVIHEDAGRFSGHRTAPPSSGPFRVTRIKVIQHLELWRSYRARREAIRNELQDNAQVRQDLGTALRGIEWTYKNAQMPVVDEGAGEAYLLHGTSEFVARMIASGNFRPDFGTKKADSTHVDPKFGALGQGTYFSDSFAKVMTYTSCPRCWGHRCQCGSERFVMLARVVLGRPTKARTHDSHRGEDVETLKDYRHSVYGFGRKHFYTRSLFGSNEFLIKDSTQAYPEYVVYWDWQEDW